MSSISLHLLYLLYIYAPLYTLLLSSVVLTWFALPLLRHLLHLLLWRYSILVIPVAAIGVY